MRLLDRFVRDERGSLMATVGKAAVAIAFLSVLAANWLSAGVSELDKNNLAQIAASVTGRPDPMITGSISKRAAETRLDPCVMPPKR
jgi:Flp pilus assembly pilin Flp